MQGFCTLAVCRCYISLVGLVSARGMIALSVTPRVTRPVTEGACIATRIMSYTGVAPESFVLQSVSEALDTDMI